MFMEIVKNRASGKYFVVIDDSGFDDFMVITPEGKIKRLERRLFGAQLSADPRDTQWRRHLTKTQVDKYIQYAKQYD